MGQTRCTWLPLPGVNQWWAPPQGVDNEAMAPASPNPSRRFPCYAPLLAWGGWHPPVDPRVIVYDNMYIGSSRDEAAAHGSRAQLPIYGVQCGVPSGAATGLKRHWNFMLCRYGSLYHEQGIQGWCKGQAARTHDLYDAEIGALKAEGQARPEVPNTLGISPWAIACAVSK